MAYIVPREMPKSCEDCQFHYCTEYHPFWSGDKEKRNTKTIRCQAIIPFRSTVLDIKDETFKPDWCPLVDTANIAPKSEWISVDERLPESDARVLVYMHENRMSYTRIDTDRVVQGKWVRWESCVTHWMPLPEPPKGE